MEAATKGLRPCYFKICIWDKDSEKLSKEFLQQNSRDRGKKWITYFSSHSLSGSAADSLFSII
jgi:hypothetical protein